MSTNKPDQDSVQCDQDKPNIATKSYLDSVRSSKYVRDATVSVTGTIGGIPGPLSVDMVTGVVTDPMTGDIIGGREAQDARAQASVDEYGFDSDIGKSQGQSPGTPGQRSDKDMGVGAEVDADPDPDEGVGGGAEIATGGFIPKRLKKKQKKMKRGGLASR